MPVDVSERAVMSSRHAPCDASGRFGLTSIRPGDYCIAIKEEDDADSPLDRLSDAILGGGCKRVTIRANEVSNIDTVSLP